MKKFLFILTGLAMVCSCSHRQPEQIRSAQADSISKVVTGLLVHDELDRAMEVADSADAAGRLTPYEAEMLRLRILGRNDDKLWERQSRYEALLVQNLTPEQQVEVLGALSHNARLLRDEQLQLRYGAQYIEACRQSGNTTQALITQAEVGSVMIRLGRIEEGLQQIDQAIEQLDAVPRFREMDACILAMKSKIRSLIDLTQYDQVIPMGERIIAKLQDFDAHPDVYADGSARMPGEQRRAGYVDFYTGQAYAFITYAYASMAQLAQARHYSRLFDQTRYSKTYGGRKQMASAWCMLGDYSRMNAVYDEMAAAMGADTVNYDYGVMLYNRATAAAATGKAVQSAAYWKRYVSLLKRINSADMIAAAEESAARYHEQEQRYALEQEQALRRRDLTIAISLGVLALMLTGFTLLVMQQLRSTRRKNAVLSQEIAANIGYKEKYLRLKSHPELSVEQKDRESQSRIDLMSDAELFEFLRVVIVSESLYLDPLFDRQQLMQRFHISKERIGAAFSQGSTFGSLASYTNECRLGHGASLLIIHPEMTVAEVATASGFSSINVFVRNFKQRYTLTPTEFRQREKEA